MANIELQGVLTHERVTLIVDTCFPPNPLGSPAAQSEIRKGFGGDGEAYRRDFAPHLSCGAAVLIAAWERYCQWKDFARPGGES